MAKQNGILPVKGKIGNLSFYKSRDGHLMREKGGVDAKRIASDPAFQRTRENGFEFVRAGKAAKLLKTAVRAISQNASDRRVTSRLVKEMMRVVKSDSVSLRGECNVTDGNIELLNGFEFNIYAQDPSINSGDLTQTEADMYGSSRLGVWNMSRDVSALSAIDYSNYSSTFDRGNKFFELDNQLGNVLVTVNDKKVGVDSNGDGVIDYNTAEVVNANDYYPFGRINPVRNIY